MADPKSEISEHQRALMAQVLKSGVIDFDRLGKLVSNITPELFNPGIAADDYIATGYSSVIKVWKTGMTSVLDNIAALRGVSSDLRNQ